MTSSHDLLTSSEAARILGRTARTVQRMVDDERLTPVRKLPGERGAFLFARADVEALAEPSEATA